MPVRPRVVLVHDYLTQRGGAERVVLSMLKAFPAAPLYTSVFHPSGTYPEFATADVRPLPLQRIRPLRRHHRWGLPLYALSFSHLEIDADVVLCSSSGWAHRVRTTGRKIVYCHTPARWLYLPEQYLRESPPAWGAILRVASAPLRASDRRAAAGIDALLVNSTLVQGRVRIAWGRDARVVPPPFGIDRSGTRQEVVGLTPGFLLVVSRLLPYKNVDAVIAATANMRVPLVIVGSGPDAQRLTSMAHEGVTFLPRVCDAELRWLYSNCSGLVAAAYEDFGLTPLEANAFGRPVAALRWGGFLETIREGQNGIFFDAPKPDVIAKAIRGLLRGDWDRQAIERYAERFSERRFISVLREVVNDPSVGRVSTNDVRGVDKQVGC